VCCESQGWGSLMWPPKSILAGCLFPPLGLLSFLSNVRLISAARHQKLRCRKWISLVVLQCSYTPVTEPVLQSIHYVRSGFSRSGATLLCHYGMLFNQEMQQGRFYLKKHPPKIRVGAWALPWIGSLWTASPMEFTSGAKLLKIGKRPIWSPPTSFLSFLGFEDPT